MEELPAEILNFRLPILLNSPAVFPALQVSIQLLLAVFNWEEVLILSTGHLYEFITPGNKIELVLHLSLRLQIHQEKN